MGKTVAEAERKQGAQLAPEEEVAQASSMPLAVAPSVQPPVALPTPCLDAQNAAVGGLNAGAAELGADAFDLGAAPVQVAAPQAAPAGPAVAPPGVGPAAGPASAKAPDGGLDWWMSERWDAAPFDAKVDELGLGMVAADPRHPVEVAVRGAIGDDNWRLLEGCATPAGALVDIAANATLCTPVLGSLWSCADDLYQFVSIAHGVHQHPVAGTQMDELVALAGMVAECAHFVSDLVGMVSEAGEVGTGVVVGAGAAVVGGGVTVGTGTAPAAATGVVAGAEGANVVTAMPVAVVTTGANLLAFAANLTAAVAADQAEDIAIAQGDLDTAAWYADVQSDRTVSAAADFVTATVGSLLAACTPAGSSGVREGAEDLAKGAAALAGEGLKAIAASEETRDVSAKTAPLAPLPGTTQVSALQPWADVREGGRVELERRWAELDAREPWMHQQLIHDLATGADASAGLGGLAPSDLLGLLLDAQVRATLIASAELADRTTLGIIASLDAAIVAGEASSARLGEAAAMQQELVASARAGVDVLRGSAAGLQDLIAQGSALNAQGTSAIAALAPLAAVPLVGAVVARLQAAIEQGLAAADPAHLEPLVAGLQAQIAGAGESLAAADAGLAVIAEGQAALAAAVALIGEARAAVVETTRPGEVAGIAGTAVAAAESAPSRADRHAELVAWATTEGQAEVDAFRAEKQEAYVALYEPRTPDAEADAMVAAVPAMAGIPGAINVAVGADAMSRMKGGHGVQAANAMYAQADDASAGAGSHAAS